MDLLVIFTVFSKNNFLTFFAMSSASHHCHVGHGFIVHFLHFWWGMRSCKTEQVSGALMRLRPMSFSQMLKWINEINVPGSSAGKCLSCKDEKRRTDQEQVAQHRLSNNAYNLCKMKCLYCVLHEKKKARCESCTTAVWSRAFPVPQAVELASVWYFYREQNVAPHIRYK